MGKVGLLRMVQTGLSWRKVPHLQEKYVHQTYGIIAEHFSHSRFAVWPKVKNFLSTFEEDSIIFDVGCGNGKYLSLKRNFLLGSDISLKLLQQAHKKQPSASLIVSDVVNIPIRSNSCDGFICIAVLHHLVSKERRERAVEEMARILRRGGRGLIYVWCFEQYLKNAQEIGRQVLAKEETQLSAQLSKEQDIFVKWHLQDAYSHHLSQELQRMPSKHAGIVKRYYHLFKKGELQNLIESVSSLDITQSLLDKDNWCCEVIKT